MKYSFEINGIGYKNINSKEVAFFVQQGVFTQDQLDNAIAQTQQNQVRQEAKNIGEEYAGTGINVPFTNEVANGVLQIQGGFNIAEKAVAKHEELQAKVDAGEITQEQLDSMGLLSQADLDAKVVNLKISDDVSLPLKHADMLKFSAWFWTRRNGFF